MGTKDPLNTFIISVGELATEPGSILRVDELLQLAAHGCGGSAEDLRLFLMTDSVDEAFNYLKTRLEELYPSAEKLDEVKLT